MKLNEMNILFVVNVIFVLIMNLNDYKSSIVLEFKSFFETHVYTVLPPSLQIIASTFINTLFDFLLMNENINKSIETLYTKTNLSVKAEEKKKCFIVNFCICFICIYVHYRDLLAFCTVISILHLHKTNYYAFY